MNVEIFHNFVFVNDGFMAIWFNYESGVISYVSARNYRELLGRFRLE